MTFKDLLTPVNVLTGLVIVVILFAGIGFTSDNLQNSDIRKILEDNEKAGKDRTEQLEALKRLQEQSMNLTAQNRAGLLRAINDTYYVTIPEINNVLKNISEETREDHEGAKDHRELAEKIYAKLTNSTP